jgi:hypothetical protein
MIVMTQDVPEQNVSCAAALATPPALSGVMLRVALSRARRTWYRLPAYAP